MLPMLDVVEMGIETEIDTLFGDDEAQIIFFL
jgi:hypothetical protein